MRVGALVACAVSSALLVAGCGEDAPRGAGGRETLTAYVSAPLDGLRGAAGRAIVNGARLALADADGRVGDLAVKGVYLDDTENGRWDLARTAENARAAAEDTSAIGFIGDLDSGATRVSLPITNQAEMVQISPGSTAVDLTRLPPVGRATPDRFQPSERRTFARLVPADDVQARAAAVWARRMGAGRVAVVNERSEFGRVLTDAFREEAARQGLTLVSGKRADVIYYGGTPAGFRAVLAEPSDLPVIGTDALLNPAFLPTVAGRQLYVTSQFIAPELLPRSGQRFRRNYRRRFGLPADPAAAYGYEAMALLLNAIRRAGDDGDERDAVIDEVLSTRDRRSVFGTYSIDGNGDTTLETISGYRVSDGLPGFPVELKAR